MSASAPTALPTFELQDLRHQDGELVVTGSWSGVRGMRFMRPTLTVAGRRALATMEHKPWAPDAEGPWVAAFPWEGGPPDPRDVSLAVAPSVTVRLAGASAAEPEPGPDPIVAERRRFERRETEVGFLRDELKAAREERDRALARVAAAEEERAAAAASAEQAERRFERAARQRDEARQERDDARAALEQERRAHQADVRRRDEALGRAAEAEAEHERTRRQRDAAGVAYRALEQRLREPAMARRLDGAGEAQPASAASAAAPATAEAREEEQPIGVRTLPAVTPEVTGLLQGRERPGLTEFDLLAFRFFGAIAAISFVALLVSLLRAIA